MDFDEFLTKFRSQFAEFSSVSDDTVENFYNLCLDIFSACNNATLYLCAHLIKISEDANINISGGGAQNDGGDGENTSEKVGQVQTTMMAMAEAGRETFFTRTEYGRIYLTLRNSCPRYVFSVIAA